MNTRLTDGRGSVIAAPSESGHFLWLFWCPLFASDASSRRCPAGWHTLRCSQRRSSCETQSDFPTAADAVQRRFGGPRRDVFILFQPDIVAMRTCNVPVSAGVASGWVH